MRLLEFQAKQVLGERGLSVPVGVVVRDVRDLGPIVDQLGPRLAIKAQIRRGGRARAGGVALVDGPAEARAAVERLVGKPLLGQTVDAVLIEQRVELAAELYVAVVTDRERGCPLVMVGGSGGVDVEDAALERPDELARAHVDIAYGLAPFQVRYLSGRAGISPDHRPAVGAAVEALYAAYRALDAMLVEVNPLGVTASGAVVVLDAHLEIDDAALFRQPNLAGFRSLTAVEERVERAGFHYVEMVGEVGLISTGSGACMAIMDLLRDAGLRPANFMELGQSMALGGAEVATEILLDRQDLAAILVAGYSGGALDRLVGGVLDVLRARPERDIPVVVSLQGRNDELAMAAAAGSGDPRVRAVPGIADAVRAVGELVGAGRRQASLPGA